MGDCRYRTESNKAVMTRQRLTDARVFVAVVECRKRLACRLCGVVEDLVVVLDRFQREIVRRAAHPDANHVSY